MTKHPRHLLAASAEQLAGLEEAKIRATQLDWLERRELPGQRELGSLAVALVGDFDDAEQGGDWVAEGEAIGRITATPWVPSRDRQYGDLSVSYQVAAYGPTGKPDWGVVLWTRATRPNTFRPGEVLRPDCGDVGLLFNYPGAEFERPALSDTGPLNDRVTRAPQDKTVKLVVPGMVYVHGDGILPYHPDDQESQTLSAVETANRDGTPSDTYFFVKNTLRHMRRVLD